MNQKIAAIIAVSAAVVAAAAAAIVVSVNRSNEARAYAEAELAAEEASKAEEHAAELKEAQERERRRAEEAKRDAAALEQKTAAANERAKDKENETSRNNLKAAEAAADEEKRKLDRAMREREKAHDELERVRTEARATNDFAKAKEAEARQEIARRDAEKIQAERVLAEKQLLELKKSDFETALRELEAWKIELEARERELKPERTVADLAWAGGKEDSVIDESGRVVKRTREPPRDSVSDTSLSGPTRRLERVGRKVREAESGHLASTRQSVVASLEKLYEGALRENRVIDAEFYRKSILSMYPDWKPKGKGGPP